MCAGILSSFAPFQLFRLHPFPTFLRTMAGAPQQNVSLGAEGTVSPTTPPGTNVSVNGACANHSQTPGAATTTLPNAFLDGRAACEGGESAPVVGAPPPVAPNPGGEDNGNVDSDADSGASALPYAHTSASTDVSGFNDTLQLRAPAGLRASTGGAAYDSGSDASCCRNCELDLDDPPGTKCAVCSRSRYCLACTPRCYNTGCLIDVCPDCYDWHEVSCPFLPTPEESGSEGDMLP